MTRPLSGIYKITNQLNGKVYIGQSQNVYHREREHWIALRRGYHENKDMQKDWNKNSRGFRFDVLELCEIKKLNDREKYWIDYYNSIERGYNKGWVPYRRKNTQNKLKVKGYRKSS